MLLAASLLFGAAAPSPLPAQAKVRLQIANVPDYGGNTHPLSGFRFPDAVENLTRTGGMSFAPDNLAVRYEGPDGSRLLMTLFVYPANVPIEQETAGVRRAIVTRWPSRPLDEAPAMPTDVDAAEWFRANVDGHPSITTYALRQRDGWSIKLRLTGPDKPETIAMFARIMAGIEWSAPMRPREE